MKKAITTAVLITAIVSFVMGQGNLTPPDAPAPGMKTLDQIDAAVAQVEPRFAITNLPVALNRSGSFYLTEDLTGADGLYIMQNNITIDLNGFTLKGQGSSSGIQALGVWTNICVKNGSATGWGNDGINLSNCSQINLTDLRVSNNGNGLICGDNAVVKHCSSANNSTDGIHVGQWCRITECVSSDNGDDGIESGTGTTISRCTINRNNYGIYAGASTIIDNCLVTRNNNWGIHVTSQSTIRECSSQHNAVNGIEVNSDCLIINNECLFNGVELNTGAGIKAISNNRIINNTCHRNNTGLKLDYAGNYVAENIVKGNTDNYDLAADNQLNLLLCEVPETLDWPCSVKFAGTLTCSITGTDGITVKADNVTIDLDGHTLIGPGASSGSGIFQTNTWQNLVVHNGSVSGWKGTEKGGIYSLGTGSHISEIQATLNYDGIVVANNRGLINDCTANRNLNSGIFADYCIINRCNTSQNDGAGIYAANSCTVNDCISSLNTGDGILVRFWCQITGNNCQNNGFSSGNGAGIHILSAGNRIENNFVTLNDRGIDVDSNNNFIIRNTTSGNTTNWDIATGNVCLVVQATTGGAISGNSGGVAPGSTDPNANFTY